MPVPKVTDLLSLDAFLFAGIFFVLTMPQSYRLTEKVVGSGWPQILVHGLLFYYLYVLLEPAFPPKALGIKRSATDSTARKVQI